MHISSALSALVLAGSALAYNNSAWGFEAETFLMFDNNTYYNHAFFLAYPQATNNTITLNTNSDNATTYCPPRRGKAGTCPTPTPSDVKTQFNTTLAPGDAPGTFHMNSAGTGKGRQQLYVSKEGVLSYTAPGVAVPKGGYANMFTLQNNYQGSQLQISTPLMSFNSSIYWYSCKPLDHASGLNTTYAQVPGGRNVEKCLPFALISDAAFYSGYTRCPENPPNGASSTTPPQYCGVAAYEYV